MQTLENVDQDSIELPAALKEVEVIQPKPEARHDQKLAKKATSLGKKKELAHGAKKSEPLSQAHPAPAKPVHEQPRSLAATPAQPHHNQISKPIQQLKSKMNELTQPVISALQKDKVQHHAKEELTAQSKEKYS